MNSPDHLLQLDGLKTHFFTFDGVAKAVDDVSFHLSPGETLGIVGESGSGKSVTALSIMGLIPQPPGRIVAGRILFNGVDLTTLDKSALGDIRGNRISMIFQEPMTSLNPLFTVGDQVSEAFIRHRGMNKKESLEQAVAMLDKVQIPAPAQRAREYPHQLSGGMRQRVMIAMALACDPEILIADEPTTALDVTIQAQVLELMADLKSKVDAAIIMITHDLGVVAQIAQRVVVMYAGKVVETGDVYTIFEQPKHPYTQALLHSIPRMGRLSRHGRRLEEIPGMVPSLYNLPAGCSYCDRCNQARPGCRTTPVEFKRLEPGVGVRCLLYE